MCFTHYGLSSRVARCTSNNNALCAAMSSCSNSYQISFFRHRDTAETDVPKSVAISLSVFPAKDISHAVKIVFVFEKRIVNSSRTCVNITFYRVNMRKSRVSTLYTVNYTLYNATCQLKTTKKLRFIAKKTHNSPNKCESRKKKPSCH